MRLKINKSFLYEMNKENININYKALKNAPKKRLEFILIPSILKVKCESCEIADVRCAIKYEMLIIANIQYNRTPHA